MPKDTEAVLDMDVKGILEEFALLPDPRSHVNRRHLLSDLVVICIMAVIAGAEGPRAIGLWAKSNADWLKGRLQLPNGVPAHDTIGRVLMALKPAAFQACFENWIRRLAANRKDVIRRAKTGHSSASKTGHHVGDTGWKDRLIRSCWQAA